jgi:hypothetical protein
MACFLVLMDAMAMRDILTLDLLFERQTERVKYTKQLYARDHVLEMIQVKLAHTEAQHFAVLWNVAEMQNQVVDLEVEVEVWQVMAHQGQQPPIAPPVAPTAPDELQGASGLSEDSVDGPPPASLETSVGSAAGN